MTKKSDFPYGIRVKRLDPTFIREMERRHKDFKQCLGFNTSDSNISKMIAEELRTSKSKYKLKKKDKAWADVIVRIRL